MKSNRTPNTTKWEFLVLSLTSVDTGTDLALIFLVTAGNAVVALRLPEVKCEDEEDTNISLLNQYKINMSKFNFQIYRVKFCSRKVLSVFKADKFRGVDTKILNEQV